MATLDDLLIGLGVTGLREVQSDLDRVPRMADEAVDRTESMFDGMTLVAPTDGVRADLDRVDDFARSAVDEAEAEFRGMDARFPGVEAGARDASSDATSVFKGLGGPLAIAAGVAGAAAGAALVHEFMDAVENERLEDRLAATLDLTADEAEDYGQLAGDLYAGAWGDSLGEVHDAIDAVSSSLGDLSFAEVEDLTIHALDLAAAFGTDVDESVNAAGVMMKTGLAKDGQEAFDLLTKGMQKAPRLMRDELIPIVEEYSRHFAGLGIDGPDAMGLLVDAAQVGRFELDKTGDAIKELSIRASDMSTASQEAYETIGLDAQQMADAIVSGGETARGAFDSIIDGLLAIEDPAEQANTAIALFGTPVEDLSVTEIPAFLERLDQMGGKFGDVEGAADRMGTTLNENVATDFESFKRRAGTAIDNWVEENILPNVAIVLDAFEEDGIGGALSTAIDLWHEAQPEVQAWWDGTFVPWFEDVAIPGMLELGKAAGMAFVEGINDIDLFPDPDRWVTDRLPDWMPGSTDPEIEMNPVPPLPTPDYPDIGNPDRTGGDGGRTATTINVTNNFPTPSSAESTSESMRRAAMEFA